MSKHVLIAGDDGSIYKIGPEELERCKVEVGSEEARQLHEELKQGADDKSRFHPLVCTAFAKADRVYVDLSRARSDEGE